MNGVWQNDWHPSLAAVTLVKHLSLAAVTLIKHPSLAAVMMAKHDYFFLYMCSVQIIPYRHDWLTTTYSCRGIERSQPYSVMLHSFVSLSKSVICYPILVAGWVNIMSLVFFFELFHSLSSRGLLRLTAVKYEFRAFSSGVIR